MQIQQIIKLLLLVLAVNVVFLTYAQQDTIHPAMPNNSYKLHFENRLNMHYSYLTSTQTHNYSGNWDFDGDGKTDSLYFVGTGGIHLHFYLRIILSSDKKVRNFHFIELDLPLLGSVDELKEANFFPPPVLPQFVVGNFNTGVIGENANDKIYVHIQHIQDIPAKWKQLGVNSSYLLISYDNTDIKIRNFIE